MTRDLGFLNFTVATFLYVNTITMQDLTRCSNEFTNDLQLLKISLSYNWSFKHLKRSDIHKNWQLCNPHPLSTKMNSKTTVWKQQNLQTHEKFQDPTSYLSPLWTYKRMLPMLRRMYKTSERWSLLSNFWNCFTVAILFSYSLNRWHFWGRFSLQILERKGILNLLFLLFLSCFLYHLSIIGVLCCLSVFCGHISVECP